MRGAFKNMAPSKFGHGHGHGHGILPHIGQAASLSQKAARKGREALFKLMALDKSRKAHLAAEAAALEANAAAAAARAKAAVLLEIEGLRLSRGAAARA